MATATVLQYLVVRLIGYGYVINEAEARIPDLLITLKIYIAHQLLVLQEQRARGVRCILQQK